MTAENVLLQVEDLVMHFPVFKGVFQRQVGAVRAVDGISFDLKRGETFGLVGESGCGKSTAGRSILQLYRPTSGRVIFNGTDLCRIRGEELRKMRSQMQMIFQDPYASLNPRMTVGEILREPLIVHGGFPAAEMDQRVGQLLDLVQLNRDYASRYPHEFSGGQRQRVGIARAVALNPELIVCDEPISALDVSIQAQIINLLRDLQEKFNLAYLFIAHDLSMVRHISQRVAVMYLGCFVEMASSHDLFANPLHPYTQALLSAVPIPDPVVEEKRERTVLEGDVPSPLDPPQGCPFQTRCPRRTSICSQARPAWREIEPGHWIACHIV